MRSRLSRVLLLAAFGLAVREAGGAEEADTRALRLAVENLTSTFPEKYKGYLERLNALVRDRAQPDKLAAFRREALLANPLLDFEKLLIVRRGERNLGLPKNWQSNSSLRTRGYDNEIALMSLKGSGPSGGSGLDTLFRPEKGEFVGDVDLDFDAGRILFSMPGRNGRWQVHEMRGLSSKAGKVPEELPLISEKDVDNYDACYLPDGNVIFTSTAPFAGVPCVKGSDHVSNLYRYDREGGRVRQLSFDQDHNWCPTVLPSGGVLYLRWEYTDIPHFVSRILFHCNPDGTGQSEYYGSGSYWPNAMFYARPVPGRPTMFVAVVGGHHDNPRMGELVLFDAARGRFEADGAVRRLGKSNRGPEVKPIILDGLTKNSWPKFLHPYPLSDKYFIVSAKPTAKSRWGIYLVDVFDNMLLLAEEKGYALLEPVPLRRTPRPPVVPSRVDLSRRDGLLFMTDIYQGPGLKGVPRGTVKKLRLVTYHFAYHGMGGQQNRVGLDGPWDIKRVLGTVPVEKDGSAFFRVPANTPISMQPLDGEGKAIQLMRSWTTVMPGERQSCVGCHEAQNAVSPAKGTLASRKAPSEISPWYGPVRGFSFKREVQPVLDRYCAGCHDGKARTDGKTLPDFTARPEVHPPSRNKGYSRGTKFTPSYMALR
ncbi:MAG: HzsA-related protein, partial [Planctomycetota bacterium]